MTTSENAVLWAGDPWDIWLHPASDIVNEQASEEQTCMMTTPANAILWAGDPWDIWLCPASDIVNEQASEEQIHKSPQA
ncbi:hypothetical protein HD554DRAFT_2178150 [Boletus coccyginus]|nr:hypothetical protein HD554DRAFT_2178150 [Boletus coccyginus]